MTQIWKEKSMFSMKLYLNSLPNPKKLISIDINDKILAIAISSADLSKSYFYKAIQGDFVKQPAIPLINKVLQKEKVIKGILFGKPHFNQIAYQKNIEAINNMIEAIKLEKIQIPYSFVDKNKKKQKLLNLQDAFKHWGHLYDIKELQNGLPAMNIMQKFLLYYNDK